MLIIDKCSSSPRTFRAGFWLRLFVLQAFPRLKFTMSRPPPLRVLLEIRNAQNCRPFSRIAAADMSPRVMELVTKPVATAVGLVCRAAGGVLGAFCNPVGSVLRAVLDAAGSVRKAAYDVAGSVRYTVSGSFKSVLCVERHICLIRRVV